SLDSLIEIIFINPIPYILVDLGLIYLHSLVGPCTAIPAWLMLLGITYLSLQFLGDEEYGIKRFIPLGINIITILIFIFVLKVEPIEWQ
ncbi:MAG TPA: hypothetical protein DCX53_09720, partial [Anaerolineae bacterium]|nr:hypothetical protein [Anaerolineae bacterium]